MTVRRHPLLVALRLRGTVCCRGVTGTTTMSLMGTSRNVRAVQVLLLLLLLTGPSDEMERRHRHHLERRWA